MSTVIRLKDVELFFKVSRAINNGKYQALNRVNIELKEGDRLGIVGSNGSGKSTLLRILAGIYPPQKGSVWRDPSKTIALLSLGLGFQLELTGRENALLAAMLQGTNRKDAEEALAQIHDFTELGDFFDQKVKSYSAGMRSRLGFATGLLLDTDVLLLDEILAVGDADFRLKAERALANKLSPDKTVVLVHHMERPIRAICERAVWIDKGSIVADGPTANVLDAYAASVK